MAKKKEKSKNLNKVDIIVTVIYTLVFCYCAYVLVIMPDSLDVMNFILLVILVLPYLIRLLGKDMIPATIALEILFIIIVGFLYVTWPTIKSSIDYDCGWGEMD
jgi:ABC-type multidrug transport system permease subunit